MSEVFVVMSGSYSDYRLEAVFDSLELATNFTGPHPDEFDYTIIPVTVNELVGGWHYWWVYYNKPTDDWTCKRASMDEQYVFNRKDLNKVMVSGGTDYSITVKATKSDDALKIGNEKIMQFIAINPDVKDNVK